MKTEIIIPAGAKVAVIQDPDGWGEEFQRIDVTGRATELEITTTENGGHGGVSIRIDACGDLTITNFGGCYETLVPQNLKLTNSRPWLKEKKP